MPAIDLTKLRAQSSSLALKFDRPDEFIEEFLELLNIYHNYSLRRSSRDHRNGYTKYSVPQSVIRQIENDMQDIAQTHPGQIETLVRSLWKTTIRESQLLAAYLIGTIPPMQALRLFSELPEQLNRSKDPSVKEALLNRSLTSLRIEYPVAMIRLISEWLTSPGQKTNIWGLHALMLLTQHLNYDNLPKVFEILKPVIINVDSSFSKELSGCINSIYALSPIETAHFLTLILNENSDKHFRLQFSRLQRGFLPSLQKDLIN